VWCEKPIRGEARTICDSNTRLWHEACVVEAAEQAYELGGEIVDTTEAGQRLGVSRRRVIAMIKAGRLPARKLGRDYIIRARDLQLPHICKRAPGYPKGRPRRPTKAEQVAAARHDGQSAAGSGCLHRAQDPLPARGRGSCSAGCDTALSHPSELNR
jgi:excisionase family DNA binding protein